MQNTTKKLSVILTILVLAGIFSACGLLKNPTKQTKQSESGEKNLETTLPSVANESLVASEADAREIINCTESLILDTICEDTEALPNGENEHAEQVDSFSASEVDISQIIGSAQDTIPEIIYEDTKNLSEKQMDEENESTKSTEPTYIASTSPSATDNEANISGEVSDEQTCYEEETYGTETGGEIWTNETENSEDMSGGEVEIEF